MKDNENSILLMRSEGDEKVPLDSSSDNLKVAAGIVITSEDQKHAASIIV